MYYIRIDRLNGMKDYLSLAENLYDRGYSDSAEYFPGGWTDNVVNNIAPHLKFDNIEDATAFSLTFGGEVSTEVPCIVL